MQEVRDAKGRFIAIIYDDNTIVIFGNNCKTIINLSKDKPIIKSSINK